MVERRLSLPVIFYLDSFFSRLLGESLYLSEEATVICNPTLPVNFILNFLNSAVASSCFACLWLFHLFSPHLIRFIWVEYSHYCCLNQLSSLLFCFSAVEAFDSCQFYDLGEKFYFFLSRAPFRPNSLCESQGEEAERDQDEVRACFLLTCP